MGNDAETDRNYLGIAGIVPRRAPIERALHWNMTKRISDGTAARIMAAWDDILCDIEANGMIGQALRKRSFSRDMVTAFLARNPQLVPAWNAAKESSADSFSEQALEMALNPVVIVTKDKDGNDLAEPLIIRVDPSHARNAIDTLKWAAKVRNPRQYSDKSSIDVNVKTVDLTRIIQDANARLAASHAGRVIDAEIVHAALPQSIDDLL